MRLWVTVRMRVLVEIGSGLPPACFPCCLPSHPLGRARSPAGRQASSRCDATSPVGWSKKSEKERSAPTRRRSFIRPRNHFSPSSRHTPSVSIAHSVLKPSAGSSRIGPSEASSHSPQSFLFIVYPGHLHPPAPLSPIIHSSASTSTFSLPSALVRP